MEQHLPPPRCEAYHAEFVVHECPEGQDGCDRVLRFFLAERGKLLKRLRKREGSGGKGGEGERRVKNGNAVLSRNSEHFRFTLE